MLPAHTKVNFFCHNHYSANIVKKHTSTVWLISYGHVRDLAARLGSVRPDEDFSMVWEVPSAAWTHLKSIKVALNEYIAKTLYGDEDDDASSENGRAVEEPKVLGLHPGSNEKILLKDDPYGH